jgi:hypothetical protein
MSIKSKGKSSVPIGAAVAREGIKAESKMVNIIAGAFKDYEAITALKNAIKQKETYTNERDTVGMSIRGWDTQGGHWRLQALFAILVEAMKRNYSKGKSSLNAVLLSSCGLHETGFGELFSEWQTFIDHLESMELMDAPSEKPIMTGTELSKELGGIKPGVWMKSALDVVMAWQLRNPDKKKDWTGAVEEVKKRSKELNIPI